MGLGLQREVIILKEPFKKKKSAAHPHVLVGTKQQWLKHTAMTDWHFWFVEIQTKIIELAEGKRLLSDERSASEDRLIR